MTLEEAFERCWPWLAEALRRGDGADLSKESMKTLLLSGKAMLWPGEGGALVTQCVIRPEGRFLHCWLGGGALPSLLAMRAGVEAWGRAMGWSGTRIDAGAR